MAEKTPRRRALAVFEDIARMHSGACQIRALEQAFYDAQIDIVKWAREMVAEAHSDRYRGRECPLEVIEFYNRVLKELSTPNFLSVTRPPI